MGNDASKRIRLTGFQGELMIGRITAAVVLFVAALLLCPIGVCWAKPTTQPAPVAKQFPSPSELVEQWKAHQAIDAKKDKVAVIELNGPVIEKEPEFSLFGQSDALTIHNLIDRLHAARDDKNLRAVVMVIGTTDFNLAECRRFAPRWATSQGRQTQLYLCRCVRHRRIYRRVRRHRHLPAGRRGIGTARRRARNNVCQGACSTRSASRLITCRLVNTKEPTRNSRAPVPATSCAAS